MEAYFHSDSRIEEWVDQITEKVFTVCLLTGVDSEVEFEKGSQIVTKLTQLLQGISIFPSEYLEDGLKQILEQQLPDSRVISNFPTFQVTMNKMLHEGMTRAIGPQSKENLKTGATSNKNNLENSREEAREATREITREDIREEAREDISEDTREDTREEARENNNEVTKAHCEETTGSSVNDLNDEFITEQAIPALASVNITDLQLWEAEAEIQVREVDEPMPTKPYGIIRKTQVPEQADRLKQVLCNIFPNVTICWNLTLMGHTFLAQVEDILIFQDSPDQPCPVKTLNKEGWKVYVCSANDLLFPRRLEREIRHIKRLGKQRIIR